MGMRILRGLASRILPCGCLAGVYETYEGEIVNILDARAPTCADPEHASGNTLPTDIIESPGRSDQSPRQ
jgi:hypothetical protein